MPTDPLELMLAQAVAACGPGKWAYAVICLVDGNDREGPRCYFACRPGKDEPWTPDYREVFGDLLYEPSGRHHEHAGHLIPLPRYYVTFRWLGAEGQEQDLAE